jgi:processive 1,2-diacylglycerol beta-glucosyltransferase
LFHRWQPDVVVSTYPITTTLLGHLRERGALAVPVCATVTDVGGLVFWAHQGIDRHLMMSEGAADQVNEILGKGSACCVRPLVAAEFFEPRGVTEARVALGLPTGSPLVVVSGGGWGVGDLEGATWTALRFPDAQVVCVAGRDEDVRRRLADTFADCGRVRVEGFVNKMSDLLAGASALVHSTGGVTVLEAAVRGCPTVSYGEPPGHLDVVVEEMVALGLVEHASSPERLHEILAAIIHGRGRRPAIERSSPSAASVVLALGIDSAA